MSHPDFKAAPRRYDDVPPVSETRDLPARRDVAIVGAGHCGPSAALELARSEAAATALDAGDLGAGGRDVGFVSASHELLLRYAARAPALPRRRNAPRAVEEPEFPAKRVFRGRPCFLPVVDAGYRLRDAADAISDRIARR